MMNFTMFTIAWAGVCYYVYLKLAEIRDRKYCTHKRVQTTVLTVFKGQTYYRNKCLTCGFTWDHKPLRNKVQRAKMKVSAKR